MGGNPNNAGSQMPAKQMQRTSKLPESGEGHRSLKSNTAGKIEACGRRDRWQRGKPQMRTLVWLSLALVILPVGAMNAGAGSWHEGNCGRCRPHAPPAGYGYYLPPAQI